MPRKQTGPTGAEPATRGLADLTRLGRRVVSRIAGRKDKAAPPRGRRDPAKVNRTRALDILRREWDWSPSLRVEMVSDGSLAFRDLRLRREGGGFVGELAGNMGPGALAPKVSRRMALFLLQFREAEGAEEMVVTLTDGHLPGTYRFSPSTPYDHVVALPDSYFFRDRGYAEARAFGQAAPDWADRDDALIWRGSPNGDGVLTWDAALAGRPGVNQRCRMALTCAGTDIDVGFVFKRDHRLVRYEPFFARAGLTRDFKPWKEWARHRYAIDIDGHSNAWDNLPIRLLLGCCVLKVESEPGFRQWYYDRLRPWEHYVPVSGDLSDLLERYDWVRSNPDRAREIARAGQSVAQGMTLEAEWAEGARLIAENWKG